ncbi:MAG: hypothetical protein NT092_09605 [Bacteroidia bacterium]|nr:hypothetical protein [Bacteroidia bacterium]
MNRWMILAFLLLLAGCREKQQDTFLTPEKANQYFMKIEAVCNRDNGKLWGKNLFGPVMYVDRNIRKIIANQPDKDGLLKEKDGIYTGTYPIKPLISNSAVRYGGTLFAMAPLPNEEDEYTIINRAIHGLFHCYQESIGYTSSGYNTANMDEKNARLWIKLEWKALRKAINSEGAEEQLAIRDALIFKGSNRELYQKYANDEIRFENYEGLAAFTYILLISETQEENKARLMEYLDRVYLRPSYARSYGAVTGALYANLLYNKGYDFKTIRSENVDLGDEVRKLYDIQLPEVCRDVAGSLALNYDIGIIQSEEEKRDADIKERIHRQISTFTEKPVVFFELESPYFDFEDSDIHPMDTLGTLYSTLRVSDNWGKLTVEKGGCLVSNNLKYLRVTSKGYKADKNRIEGEGWHLVLNNGWELMLVNENYLVRKLMP